MAINYKGLYEKSNRMLELYQDEIVPGFRAKIKELESKTAEIVHCKDCIHQRNTDGFYACHKFMGNNVSIITSPNNYCCCGKRKEEV